VLYPAMTTARTTSQSPSTDGRATLETMTTAQNRAILDEAEARVDKAARARAQDTRPPTPTPWDAPDDTTGSYIK
jgi:GTPase